MLEWCRLQPKENVNLNCLILASETGIRAIEFQGKPESSHRENPSHPFLRQAVDQLESYFAGDLHDFDLPLDMQGTPFQKRVWSELLNIPYGRTCSYSFIANAIGSPKAVRAVGAANGSNPIPIVVPCHRVIGAAGKLVGYGGGLPLKRFLLDLESRNGQLFAHA